MHTKAQLRSVLAFAVMLGLVPAVRAQDPAVTPIATPVVTPVVAPIAAAPQFLVRSYPKDRDVAVAVVGMRTITLGDLVDHIDERHYPGFKKALEQPGIQAYLQSDLIAPWVRQMADLEALRQTFNDPPIDEEKVKDAQSESLRQSFQGFLDNYIAARRQRGQPTELSQHTVNSLLADFQLKNGLAAEMQGLLDYLEPGDYNTRQLRNYYNDNARVFGGVVTIEHILVQFRDGGTGILLNDEGLARANAKLADIKARLRPDGSNFEDIARSFSDDTRTAKDGGRLEGVHRFDDRLPATLCRAAWNLKDGEVSDVVESQYGWHLIKRVDFAQPVFILVTDETLPQIKQVMRRAMQEERLFDARKKTGVSLRL